MMPNGQLLQPFPNKMASPARASAPIAASLTAGEVSSSAVRSSSIKTLSALAVATTPRAPDTGPLYGDTNGAMIQLRDVSKSFNDEAVVQDITFDVMQGEIFGFIGPSGSGKTTTIRLITGVYKPTSGSPAWLPSMMIGALLLLLLSLLRLPVAAGTMAAATLLKTDFLESFADKTTLLIDQELPVGTRLSATSEAAQPVEQVLGDLSLYQRNEFLRRVQVQQIQQGARYLVQVALSENDWAREIFAADAKQVAYW